MVVNTCIVCRLCKYSATVERKEKHQICACVHPSPFVVMATYFMLRESHKGDEEQSEPHPTPCTNMQKERRLDAYLTRHGSGRRLLMESGDGKKGGGIMLQIKGGGKKSVDRVEKASEEKVR
ncbi:hypothetical protein NPIL_199011 [Nephila pilipes]|uniref:Uncharacterized protein n=1 Tax=Nephila pilipes TaxID=299642 RepID=A0A8X6TL43_NEPPI|nr:hypothetical protein NPIL_199011 [Nephila pilipes]